MLYEKLGKWSLNTSSFYSSNSVPLFRMLSCSYENNSHYQTNETANRKETFWGGKLKMDKNKQTKEIPAII